MVAECEKTFCPVCSLEWGDADFSVYFDTGLEIYRKLRVTIHVLKMGCFNDVEDRIEGSVLLEFLNVSILPVSLYN